MIFLLISYFGFGFSVLTFNFGLQARLVRFMSFFWLMIEALPRTVGPCAGENGMLLHEARVYCVSSYEPVDAHGMRIVFWCLAFGFFSWFNLFMIHNAIVIRLVGNLHRRPSCSMTQCQTDLCLSIDRQC